MNFNKNKFINDIIIEYNNTNVDYSIIFDNHFNNIMKTYDIKTILYNLCSIEEIEDAKYRYSNKYIELKLILVLYNELLNNLL